MQSYFYVFLSLLFVIGLIYLLAYILQKINFLKINPIQKKNDFSKQFLAKGYHIISIKTGERVQQFLETPSGICLISESNTGITNEN